MRGRGWGAYRPGIAGPLARGLERLGREIGGCHAAIEPLNPLSLRQGNLEALAADLERLARMARGLADLARRGAA